LESKPHNFPLRSRSRNSDFYPSGVLPWRLRVPERGRGQGDVHHQARQAGRGRGRRTRDLRHTWRRCCLWRGNLKLNDMT
jgi:hypothetical protein